MKPWNLLPRGEVLLSSMRRAYHRSELRKLWRWLKGKTLHWALHLTLASLLAGGLLFLHYYSHSHFYVVRVDGHEAGLVRDADAVEHFLDQLMDRCGSLYGMEVAPQQDISLTWELRWGEEADFERTGEALKRRVNLVTEAVMVLVDGSPVVPVYTEQEIDAVIELLGLAYIGPGENVELLEVELVEQMSGELCVVPPEQVYNPEEVASLLKRPVQEREALAASREFLPSRSGLAGQSETEPPPVHVITTEKATLEEPVPFTTTYTGSSSMFIGESRVVNQGEDGLKKVTYRVTRENGVEIDREALEEQVVKEPVTRVVERGTARRFVWPVAGGGRLTQYFRGAAHRGIDIAAPLGTAILAADGGVVVRSTYAWPMGNYIILNHGGYFTVYLHNSRNLVSAGQRVSRGQTIARLGSTGRSTGPHLHFEIRRNNGSGIWTSWTAHPAIDPLQFFR